MKIKIITLLTISFLTQITFANETSLSGAYKGILNCPGEGKVKKLYAILAQQDTEISGQFLVNNTIHNIEVGYADDEGVFSMTSNSLDFNGEYGTNFKKISGTSCAKNNGIFKLFKTKDTASIQTRITQAKQRKQQQIADKKLDQALTGLAKKEYQQCQQGDMRQCTSLGYHYEKGEEGASQSNTQAVKYLQKGCDGGNDWGCGNLGIMYEYSKGVSQSDTQAVKYYQKGCDGGDAQGCNNLGTMYEYGRGVSKSNTTAVKYYQKGCDGGVAFGCTSLGYMYKYGKGVSQSDTQAVKYDQKGCDGGSAFGCTSLGLMYESGRGVSKSNTTAEKYYQKGCDGGHDWGCEKLKKLVKNLNNSIQHY